MNIAPTSLLDLTAAPSAEEIRQKLIAARIALANADAHVTELQVLADTLAGADPSLAGELDTAKRRAALLDDRVRTLETDLAAAVAAEEEAAATARAAKAASYRDVARSRTQEAVALVDQAHAELVAAVEKARRAVDLCAEARSAAWEALTLEGGFKGSADHLANLPVLGADMAALVRGLYDDGRPPMELDICRDIRVAASQIVGRFQPASVEVPVSAAPPADAAG